MGGLWARGPSPGHCHKFIAVLLPIVESLGVEFSAVWPLDRSGRLVELNGVEQRQILERSKHVPFQNGPTIDALPGAVVELKRQRVRPNDVELLDAMEGVIHMGVFLGFAQWLDRERRLAGLQEGPILQQFLPMDLGPRLNQPLLRPRKVATEALDGIKSEGSLGFLIRRMEVGSMMGRSELHEHPDDDSEKTR